MSTVRVLAGCAVDGASLIAGCVAYQENAAAIAALRLLAARRDSTTGIGRMPPETIDRIVDWTMGRAIASARGRLTSLVGSIYSIETRPFFRVLQRFGLRLVVQRPSSHADMMLEYAGNACDCEECQDSSAPTTGELLDARRFFVTLKLASSDQKAQRDAQTSSLEPIEDSMDDRNCYAPADCFEISPARLSDGQLRRYRCAVELLRLKTPVVPVDVRPLSGKAPQADAKAKAKPSKREKPRRVSTTPKIFVLHNACLNMY